MYDPEFSILQPREVDMQGFIDDCIVAGILSLDDIVEHFEVLDDEGRAL